MNFEKNSFSIFPPQIALCHPNCYQPKHFTMFEATRTKNESDPTEEFFCISKIQSNALVD